jgi:hypothetical protein
VCRCEAPRGYVSAHNPFDMPTPADHISRSDDNTLNGKPNRRLDQNMCFNVDGMDLHLDGPNPAVYQQGDTYEEHGLQVSDHQPENFMRRVSIQYSSPLGSYFSEPGTHYVYYTIQTPWLPSRANITKTRYVNTVYKLHIISHITYIMRVFEIGR